MLLAHRSPGPPPNECVGIKGCVLHERKCGLQTRCIQSYRTYFLLRFSIEPVPRGKVGHSNALSRTHTRAVHLSSWFKKEVIGHWLRGVDGELPPNSDLPTTSAKSGRLEEEAHEEVKVRRTKKVEEKLQRQEGEKERGEEEGRGKSRGDNEEKWRRNG